MHLTLLHETCGWQLPAQELQLSRRNGCGCIVLLKRAFTRGEGLFSKAQFSVVPPGVMRGRNYRSTPVITERNLLCFMVVCVSINSISSE
ncbi:hypothetical protein CDAR_495481 [Caerostris darwini]|uniref:Uncharacterized protein n=1 Tax=Caerostris darwini TaxID=1538125 RepID=A0AAV4S8G1_9ARAC|nr:hypothetical protein CDAR_495481 [Caerostris darwini]